MKLSLNTAIATTFIGVFTLSWGFGGEARPYPDSFGVCYFYRGDTQEILEPCVIGTGYGAGAHYAVLRWSDGVDTSIMMINFCPNLDFDEHGFCRYTVDDYAAEPYERDVFLNITTSEDVDNLSCYRIIETGNSVCYRFN